MYFLPLPVGSRERRRETWLEKHLLGGEQALALPRLAFFFRAKGGSRLRRPPPPPASEITRKFRGGVQLGHRVEKTATSDCSARHRYFRHVTSCDVMCFVFFLAVRRLARSHVAPSEHIAAGHPPAVLRRTMFVYMYNMCMLYGTAGSACGSSSSWSIWWAGLDWLRVQKVRHVCVSRRGLADVVSWVIWFGELTLVSVPSFVLTLVLTRLGKNILHTRGCTARHGKGLRVMSVCLSFLVVWCGVVWSRSIDHPRQGRLAFWLW